MSGTSETRTTVRQTLVPGIAGVATVALVVVACLLSLVSLIGSLSLVSTLPVYFPGDPPVADLLLQLGVATLTLAGVALAVMYAVQRLRGIPSARRVWLLGLAGLAMSLASLLLPLWVVGSRHFGEWAKLKIMLEEASLHAGSVSGCTPGAALAPEQFEAATILFRRNPVHFKFRNLPEPVELRVLSALPPYVGVNFGNGRNAVFDLTTMLCVYSD